MEFIKLTGNTKLFIIFPTINRKEKMEKRFLIATSVMIGTCIGAGVLGIPYVAAQAGFFIATAYIILIGAMILLINLYLGEISLRTKERHQLPGYAQKYLGKNGKWLMGFALIFGVYSAIVAYIFGMGESLSFLFFQNNTYTTLFGIFVGAGMSGLLWKGIKGMKKYEKIGVGIILFLFLVIVATFFRQINFSNLNVIHLENALLPFGVVLFAWLSFSAIPEINIILSKNKNLMKKVIFSGTFISIIFYILFAFVIVGFKGSATPEIATLTLGTTFILLGIFTMFTSYLVLGNVLEDNFKYDDKTKRNTAWFLASVVPILIFLLIRLFDFFSFTKILSIGGVVSGGLTTILVLFMIKNAKKTGDRKPEYNIPVNWFLIFAISLIFLGGVLREIFIIIKNF